MVKYKAGDKVKCLLSGLHFKAGEIYEVGYCLTGDGDFGVKDKEGYVTDFGRMCSDVPNREYGFNEHNFELVEPKDPYEAFRNLPVGTKFVLRDDLEVDTKMGGWYVEDTLMELKGLILTVDKVSTSGDVFYSVGNQDYISPEMIDRVITEEIVEVEEEVKLVKCVETNQVICKLNHITEGKTYRVIEEHRARSVKYYVIIDDEGEVREVYASRFEEVEEEAPTITEEDILHNHYFIDVGEFLDQETGRCIIDVYVILEKFKDISPAMQHVVKKALVTGGRGSKDYLRDLQDIIDTAEREKVIHSKR